MQGCENKDLLNNFMEDCYWDCEIDTKWCSDSKCKNFDTQKYVKKCLKECNDF